MKYLIGLIFELSKMTSWLADRVLFLVCVHIFVTGFTIRVQLNRNWFVIQNEVLNFHNEICCYHELFHKAKRIKLMKLSMDLWHLDNMKIIITLWTMNCWLCSFYLYWFFLYYSQSSQVILKNLILEFPKKTWSKHNWFDWYSWLHRIIFELW